jgi:hypothetical protein
MSTKQQNNDPRRSETNDKGTDMDAMKRSLGSKLVELQQRENEYKDLKEAEKKREHLKVTIELRREIEELKNKIGDSDGKTDAIPAEQGQGTTGTRIGEQELMPGRVNREGLLEVIEEVNEGIARDIAINVISFQYDVAKDVGDVDSPQPFVQAAHGIKEILPLACKNKVTMASIYKCMDKKEDAPYIEFLSQVYPKDDVKFSDAEIIAAKILVGFFKKNNDLILNLAKLGKQKPEELTIGQALNAFLQAPAIGEVGREIANDVKTFIETGKIPNPMPMIQKILHEREALTKKSMNFVIAPLSDKKVTSESSPEEKQALLDECSRVFSFLQSNDNVSISRVESAMARASLTGSEKNTIRKLCKILQSEDTFKRITSAAFIHSNVNERPPIEKQTEQKLSEIFKKGDISLADGLSVYYLLEAKNASQVLLTFKVIRLLDQHGEHKLAADRYQEIVTLFKKQVYGGIQNLPDLLKEFNLDPKMENEITNIGKFIGEETKEMGKRLGETLVSFAWHNPREFGALVAYYSFVYGVPLTLTTLTAWSLKTSYDWHRVIRRFAYMDETMEVLEAYLKKNPAIRREELLDAMKKVKYLYKKNSSAHRGWNFREKRSLRKNSLQVINSLKKYAFQINQYCPALGRAVNADDIGRITRAQTFLKQTGFAGELTNEAKVAIIQAHEIKGTAGIGKGVNGTIYKEAELAKKARILNKFFTDAQWRTMLQHGICGDALDLIDRRIASGASKSAGFTDDVLKAAGEAADKVDDAAKVADKAAEVVRSVDSFDDLKRVVLEAKTVNDHKKIAELLKTHKKIIDAAAKAGNAEAKALRSSMSVLGRFGKIGFIGLAIDAAFLGANEYQIEQARKTGNAEIVRTLQSKRNVSLGQTAVGTPLFLLSGPQIAAVLPVYIASSVATQAIYDGVTEWEKTERDWLHEHEDALLAKLRELPYGQADYAHRFGDGLYAAYTPISAERQDKIDQINQNTRQEILRAYFMKTMQLHEVPGETEQETHARVKQNVLRRMAFIKGWTSGTFDVSNVGKRIFDLSAEYAELMELKQILQKQNHELVLRYEWEGEQRVLDLRKLIVLTQSTADPKDRMFALQVLHRYKEEFLPQMRIAQKIYEELAEEAKVDAVLSGRAPGLKIELPKGKNSFMLPGLARVVVEMENGERHVGSGVGNQLREPVRQFLDIIDLNAPANRKKYVNDIKKIARYAIVDGKLVKQAPSDGAAVGMRVHENERLNIRRILCSGGDGIVTVVEFAHDPVRNARGRLQQELSRTPKDDPRHIADNREGQSR